MKDKEVAEYLEKYGSLGSRPGLESILDLCDRLSNPQDAVPVIHIAGTNGKGSTAAFITAILTEAGYKVGKYTSPAVFAYEERFQINHKNITKKKFAEIFTEVAAVADAMEQEGKLHPTVFEMETAAAFCFFKKEKCDIAVIETGMGGLLDATNIMKKKLASVFTPISMDHMQFLGNSIEAIAEQKAGIIKNSRYVIAGTQEKEAELILRKKAMQDDSEYVKVDGNSVKNVKTKISKPTTFNYKQLKRLEIKLLGQYQIENAILAIEVAETITKAGYAVSEEHIRKGLKKAQWNGRFTVLSEKPLFVMDGAHNEDAAIKLSKSIVNYFTNKRIIYIMGMLRDKDIEAVIKNTYRHADYIITVKPPNNVRAMDAIDLAKEVMEYHPCVTAVDSVEEAVEAAYAVADKSDVIIAFGSLSYLGRLSQVVTNRQKNVSKNGL